MLNNLLGTGQFVMAKVLMESFEMSTTEIQEILQENLQLMQFKAAQMASEAEARAAQSGKDNGIRAVSPGVNIKLMIINN